MIRAKGLLRIATCLLLSAPSVHAADALPAASESCYDTQTILVLPRLNPTYRQTVADIIAGIRAAGLGELAVCPLREFESPGSAFEPTTIFALGDQVASALAAKSGKARVIALLVQKLPPPVDSGISLFLDPARVLDDILSLHPATRSLHFVHRARIPAAIVDRVRDLAHQRGIDFEPVAVSSLRSAAQAIERLKTIPATGAIVWFHKGVLGLNPDILVPNLVRISWARDLPVVADRVDYVQRGVLLAVSP